MQNGATKASRSRGDYPDRRRRWSHVWKSWFIIVSPVDENPVKKAHVSASPRISNASHFTQRLAFLSAMCRRTSKRLRLTTFSLVFARCRLDARFCCHIFDSSSPPLDLWASGFLVLNRLWRKHFYNKAALVATPIPNVIILLIFLHFLTFLAGYPTLPPNSVLHYNEPIWTRPDLQRFQRKTFDIHIHILRRTAFQKIARTIPYIPRPLLCRIKWRDFCSY